MKKAIKLFVVLIVLIVSSTNLAHATQEYCTTVTVYCANGNAGYGLVCGSTPEEFSQNVAEMASVICNG
jgi:hypothetical protein